MNVMTRTLLSLAPAAALLSACGGEPQQSADGKATHSPSVAARDTAPAAFTACRTCHSVVPGRNGIGPSLAGIVGTKAGDVPGFAFSPALRGSGIVWTPATLDQWLAGPVKLVPGTRMVMAVSDPARRKEIVDYLAAQK